MRPLSAALACVLLVLSFGSASAAERIINAFAPLVVVGEHDVVALDGTTTMSGSMQGPLYGTTGGTVTERGDVKCRFTLKVDSETLVRDGDGTCSVVFHDGGEIAADINCTSDGHDECVGEFIITSGSGAMRGARGRGPVRFQTRNKGYQIAEDGALTETVFGTAYWDDYRFQLPD